MNYRESIDNPAKSIDAPARFGRRESIDNLSTFLANLSTTTLHRGKRLPIDRRFSEIDRFCSPAESSDQISGTSDADFPSVSIREIRG